MKGLKKFRYILSRKMVLNKNVRIAHIFSVGKLCEAVFDTCLYTLRVV